MNQPHPQAELKACPFCQKQPLIMYRHENNHDKVLQCRTPNCALFGTSFLESVWNTRHQPPEVEQLKKGGDVKMSETAPRIEGLTSPEPASGSSRGEMKSAEKFAYYLDAFGTGDWSSPQIIAQLTAEIKQRDLNAWRQGMTDAADKANDYDNDLDKCKAHISEDDQGFAAQWYVKARNDSAKAILKSRDERKEI